MKARVKYYSDYNGKEGYAIEIFNEKGAFDDYGLDTFFPLARREGAGEDEERNYVYFGLINKIPELVSLGYTVIFK